MSQSKYIQNLKGEAGSVYIADTDEHTGSFEAIQCLEAAVVALVSSNMSGTLTAVTIPAGAVIFAKFSSITLASGTVIAYNQTP